MNLAIKTVHLKTADISLYSYLVIVCSKNIKIIPVTRNINEITKNFFIPITGHY